MSVDGKTARFGAGLVVFVCFLVAAIEGYDIQAFGVASPKLVRELGLGPAQQGWSAAAAMIGLMIGAIIGGRLADRIGRKPVLLVSVAAFALGGERNDPVTDQPAGIALPAGIEPTGVNP